MVVANWELAQWKEENILHKKKYIKYFVTFSGVCKRRRRCECITKLGSRRRRHR